MLDPIPTPVIDLDELTRRTNRTAAQLSAWKAALVVCPFAAGVILGLISIGEAAQNNWHAVNIQNGKV